MLLPRMDKIPNYSKTLAKNRWADYIELLCYTNIDGEISLSDVMHNLHSEDPDSLDVGTERHSERYDTVARQFSEVFDIIKNREDSLKFYYPFRFADSDTIEISDSLDDYKLFYLDLLFASNLAYFDQKTRSILTSEFEYSCKHIMGLIYPNFQTEVFGTSTNATDLFHGNSLLERLKILSNQLNTRVSVNAAKNPRYLNPCGDAGLDIVSFSQLDSEGTRVSRVPLCLGQCACSYEEWKEKQFSITHQSWNSKIDELAHFHEMIFVPFPIRDSEGRWAVEDVTDINTIPVDRFRIIHILQCKGENQLEFFKESRVYQILNERAS